MSHTKNLFRKQNLICNASALAALCYISITPVAAQDAPGEVAYPDQRIDEIIVTARRREEPLQEVPISVSAVDGELIERAGLQNLEALSMSVPGLYIGKNPITSTIFLRGVGSGVNRAFEQSVGMYIDNIYMGRDRQYRSPFLDIAQVEVLRGPQGTLFGKNTIAGAVNVTTRSAEVGEEMNGFTSIDYAPEFDTRIYSGAVSLPLGDRAAIRVAAKYQQSDGYLYNNTQNSDEPTTEETTVRVSLSWEPVDSLKIQAKVSYSNFDSVGNNAVQRVFQVFTGGQSSPLGPAAASLVTLADPAFQPGAPGFTTYRDSSSLAVFGAEEFSDNKVFNGVLKADLAIGDGLLTSITGYSEYEFTDFQDVDFLPISFLQRKDRQKFDQVSQEIRYSSPTSGKFFFVLGGYFERQNLSIAGGPIIDSQFGGLLPGPLFDPVRYITRIGDFDQEATNYAFFGEATLDITDQLTFTFGARWTHDKKTVSRSLYLAEEDPNVVSVNPDGTFADPVNGPIVAAIWGGVFGTYPHDLSGLKLKNSEFLPAANLSYAISDDVMAYFSYSKGYKSGGFDGDESSSVLPDGSAADSIIYDPETANSFEIGLKSQFFDRRLTLNVAAFQTKFSNLQVTTFRGLNFAVGNAAKARIRGVDVDGVFRIANGWNIAIAAEYLDYEFLSYPSGPCTALQLANTSPTDLCTQDLTGRPGAFAPKYSANIRTDYTFHLSDTLDLNFEFDANYKSSLFLDFDLDPDSLQQEVVLLNTRVALQSISGWEIAFFWRNLTNEKIYTFDVDTPLITGAHSGHIGEPRTLGMQARYSF